MAAVPLLVAFRMDLASLLSATILRLCLAALLGGVIGVERELKGKPAGLRTNMFICFGSAMFTILSTELAADFGGDHTRIAAQIIPGIGFIGAGSILHSRGSVSGLTTAATMFVVASIGMAVGGGLYLPAIFATLVIFLALEVLGYFEGRYGIKALLAEFELSGPKADELFAALEAALTAHAKGMQSVNVQHTPDGYRIQFAVDATRREQRDILQRLRTAQGVTGTALVGASTEYE
jgi:putative Mg2+ transporter-C (MgtC) family protein